MQSLNKEVHQGPQCPPTALLHLQHPLGPL